jgi:exosome complex RNA-binding protein Csl4
VETVNQRPTVVPAIQSVVIAQVTKVTPRFAQVSIMCVEDKPLNEQFAGMIRSTDVRCVGDKETVIERTFLR